MYFWEMHLLKKQLIEANLTEGQLFSYILVYVALSAIVVEAIPYFPFESLNIWNYVQSIANVVIAIIGTVWIFRANGGKSGHEFAARYFSVGFVATIRFLALLLPLMVVMIVIHISVYGTKEEVQKGITEFVLFSTWYVLLYVYIAKQLREIAEKSLRRTV